MGYGRTAFNSKNFGDSVVLRGICTEAVNGFRGKGDNAAIAQQIGSCNNAGVVSGPDGHRELSWCASGEKRSVTIVLVGFLVDYVFATKSFYAAACSAQYGMSGCDVPLACGPKRG